MGRVGYFSTGKCLGQRGGGHTHKNCYSNREYGKTGIEVREFGEGRNRKRRCKDGQRSETKGSDRENLCGYKCQYKIVQKFQNNNVQFF